MIIYTKIIEKKDWGIHMMDLDQTKMENLIEQYEKLVFNFEQRDYQQIIKDNISSFEFSSCCNAYYNGKINLIIGKGLGLTFSGDLKHNICDENAIREKFYIFEIFN